jgi:hypothetical protein
VVSSYPIFLFYYYYYYLFFHNKLKVRRNDRPGSAKSSGRLTTRPYSGSSTSAKATIPWATFQTLLDTHSASAEALKSLVRRMDKSDSDHAFELCAEKARHAAVLATRELVTSAGWSVYPDASSATDAVTKIAQSLIRTTSKGKSQVKSRLYSPKCKEQKSGHAKSSVSRAPPDRSLVGPSGT